jgi:hypothetical protein
MLWESVVPAAALRSPGYNLGCNPGWMRRHYTNDKPRQRRGLDIRIGTKEASRGGPSSLNQASFFTLRT